MLDSAPAASGAPDAPDAVPATRIGALPRLAGATLGAGFRVAATARGDKPLHPTGVVLAATVRRWGTTRRWDAAWLDEPGTDVGVVRLSRSLGLPQPLPDVLGLALGFDDAAGRHDLLLSTTGLGRAGRFALVPRRDPAAAAYTSLLPYRTPRGRVLLAAVPDRRVGEAAGLRFRLLAAAPTGPWTEFGVLGTAGLAEAADAQLAFDPVLHPLPGLVIPPALAVIRARAYAGARRARGEALPAEAVAADPTPTVLGRPEMP